MSISYEEALATLEGMFGEQWSRDNLDTVLRNQNGHMENTVDLILSHGERSPSILIDKLNAGEDPRASSIDADAELARQLANPTRVAAVSGAQTPPPPAPSQTGRRGTPTELPPDFLRISSQPTTTGTDQMESDEALARMLQDKMFTEEISRNPDFAHLARGNNRSNQRVTDNSNGGSGPSQQFKPPDIDIMKSLGDLGNNARRKLQVMAAQFNKARGANQNNVAAASGSAGGSMTERRGLLDGESNEDDVALEFATRKDL
mmetsp:Transcript_9581/g.12667  ORF Transcript_9581/g.12667 Transcript_9581/m.12667 type:complete len:261 (-) Transcript_9581:55-837(-)